eukprot:m.1465461 g.1465461  ORF g.1465461 m.1465461 type:complete len:72 (-) comp25136_c0_seq15:1692-1907(-)
MDTRSSSKLQVQTIFAMKDCEQHSTSSESMHVSVHTTIRAHLCTNLGGSDGKRENLRCAYLHTHASPNCYI